MKNGIKRIFFVIAVVMIFTAQTNRPDDKGQEHASAARPAPAQMRTVTPQHTAYKAQPSQPARQERVPQHTAYKAQPIVQYRQQPSFQQRPEPFVRAVPPQAPVENNRFLNRQHHNHWQPRYNFFDNQYHFYPYVNIAAVVDLSGGYMVAGPDGQNYYYDQGTFYLQDQNGQYAAVPPPVGIIVNPVAANARQVIVDGQVFWRYKGVFYTQVAQGYQVIGPVQPVPADM